MTARAYPGRWDPLATFARLREAGVLGRRAYLHLEAGRGEIGWAPVATLQLLDGTDAAASWRAQLRAFVDAAAARGSRAFGYVGYDAIDCTVGVLPDGSARGWPLVAFLVPGERVVFTAEAARHESTSGLELAPYLSAEPVTPPGPAAGPLAPVAELPPAVFEAMVAEATAALQAGAAQKVVLARYQAYEVAWDPVVLFAAYCQPAAYTDACLLLYDDLTAVVASPELLLAVADGQLVTNPLAGTRPRGATTAEDARLRAELQTDRKELAEHVLSVTTMWAELEPVCRPDSLAVRRLLAVVRQPRVQHLSSVLAGQLAPEHHLLDALWALFPSVTVTGLPKREALALLRRLEPAPRGIYAGVFGWASGRADGRFALAIRGVYRYGRRTFLQAGAGIMPESRPAAERAEVAAKLQAMEDALARSAGHLVGA